MRARQVTACEFADDGMTVFTGGLDNEIKVWDMKMDEVSALVSISLEGRVILIEVWDMKMGMKTDEVSALGFCVSEADAFPPQVSHVGFRV